MPRKSPSRSRPSEAPKPPKRAPTAKASSAASATRSGIRTPRTGLTAAEEAFCQHFAVNKVGSEAVRHAWPEWRTKPDQYVAQKASKLKASGKIQERIDRLSDKTATILERKFEITTEKILEEIAATAFANAGDYYDWGVKEVPRIHRKTGQPIYDDAGKMVTEMVPYAYAKPASALTRQQKAAIVGAEQSIAKTGETVVSVKMANKLAALGLLLQHTTKQAEKAPPAPVQVNVVGAAQVVTDSASIATMSDPKAALRAFEEARARLMPPRK